MAQGSERNEGRLVGVRSAKHGWLHLWTPGGERFTHQLLGKPFDPDTGYELRVAYRLFDSHPPLFQYWVDGLPDERRSHDIDLANRLLTFDEAAKSLREIRDPVGPCLRNMPYDLAHIGDSALLLAVTDTADPPSEFSPQPPRNLPQKSEPQWCAAARQ